MRKICLLAVTTALLVLCLAGVAQAYDPVADIIYLDYATDRHIDGNPSPPCHFPYTEDELNAYLDALDDPAFLQYKSRGIYIPAGNQVRRLLRALSAESTSSTDPSASSGQSTFPVTGAQGMVALLGGLALVGSGVAIRRRAR